MREKDVDQVINVERNRLLDVIRGLMIVLVVLGHSIQIGSGAVYLQQQAFFDDVFFKIIYSFHMPLFMLVSGYLFGYSVKKSTLSKLVLNRLRRIVIPILMWSALLWAMHWVRNLAEFNMLNAVGDFLSQSLQAFWFLWAVFYCSLITAVIEKLLKGKWYIWMAVAVIALLTPDKWNIGCYKFMLVFFAAGFYYWKHAETAKAWMSRGCRKMWLLLGSFAIWLSLMFFYSYDYFIYTSGITLLGKNITYQLMIDVLRITIGFAGSFWAILATAFVIKKIGSNPPHGRRPLAALGGATMGIYILSTISNIVLEKLTVSYSHSIWINLAETTVVLTLAWIGTWILRRLRITRILLLGEY